ncbi:MAG: hypothetical protein IRZ05_01695 [Micromonosporaceae bacterium]|nr:hypothetical protein [Micromonosporaceae bacterium]
MLRVVTPPASTALTTPEAVRAAFPDAPGTLDLESLIARASDAIVAHCGRPFARATYEERLPGYGTQTLLLTRRPVRTVTQVLHNSEPIVDYVIADPDTGALYREQGWTWTAATGWGLAPQRIGGTERPAFVVTYEAGYLLPGQEGRDLPADVEQACIETVIAMIRRQSTDQDITEMRMDDVAVKFVGARSALPAIARELLAPYVEVV